VGRAGKLLDEMLELIEDGAGGLHWLSAQPSGSHPPENHRLSGAHCRRPAHTGGF
jgi:hypothetical protein